VAPRSKDPEARDPGTRHAGVHRGARDIRPIRPPGLGDSSPSRSRGSRSSGYKVLYREAHVAIDDVHHARELGELLKHRAPPISW
jgi:hypothetical protein